MRVLLVLLVFGSALALHGQEGLPLPVFVTHLETPPLPPLRPEQHEAAIKGTRTEMFDVAARLRKQHGDKTSDWAPEVWKVFNQAEDANSQAIARRDYQPSETRLGLSDSVEDFLRGAGGNKGMTVVPGADQANLVVQIVGRRRAPARDVTDNRYFIRFRVAPGAKMTTDRFLELAYGYKWNNLWARQLAHATEASPYVELEAGSPASYKNCAGTVRAIVEGFIRARMDPAKKK
jgi:hypothetical protein